MAIIPRRSSDPFAGIIDSFLSPFGGGMGDLLRAPATDVIETQDAIRVTAEMPGLRPEDVDISLENNILTISGEKREERTEGEEGRYHLAERRYGRFVRSFVLPRDVDQDRAESQAGAQGQDAGATGESG